MAGIGWQHIGAYANLGAYDLAGIPMGVLGAFVLHLRAECLWLGMLCGSTVQGILLALVSIFTNWKNQVLLLKLFTIILCYSDVPSKYFYYS